MKSAETINLRKKNQHQRFGNRIKHRGFSCVNIAVIISMVMILGIGMGAYADDSEGETIPEQYGVTEIGTDLIKA